MPAVGTLLVDFDGTASLVSDGFAFYIRPILEAAGLAQLPVVTNETVFLNGRPELRHPNDRYGAFYSDVVFAKKDLVDICERDGVPYFRWETFDDVRQKLESLESLPGSVAPVVCPGWTTR
jgi:2-hydroxy-3-keto-5-methylthiopentenyl-1-phosphate phosphatase